jgi:hypothetical protein
MVLVSVLHHHGGACTFDVVGVSHAIANVTAIIAPIRVPNKSAKCKAKFSTIIKSIYAAVDTAINATVFSAC